MAFLVANCKTWVVCFRYASATTKSSVDSLNLTCWMPYFMLLQTCHTCRMHFTA